jgi:hypothetical protein
MSSLRKSATSTALACSTLRIESLDHIRFDVPCPNLPIPESMGLAERVLCRIREVEQKESGAWERDDLRVAWLTVSFAAQGQAEPWRAAFIHYFDGRPEKMIPFWVAREAKNRAELGPSLAEEMLAPDFLANLQTVKPFHSKPQTEFPFITAKRDEFRAVMQGKKAA